MLTCGACASADVSIHSACLHATVQQSSATVDCPSVTKGEYFQAGGTATQPRPFAVASGVCLSLARFSRYALHMDTAHCGYMGLICASTCILSVS